MPEYIITFFTGFAVGVSMPRRLQPGSNPSLSLSFLCSSPKITNVNSQWTSEVYFANFDVNSDCPSKALLTLKFGFQWSFGFSMTKDVSSIYLSQS